MILTSLFIPGSFPVLLVDGTGVQGQRQYVAFTWNERE